MVTKFLLLNAMKMKDYVVLLVAVIIVLCSCGAFTNRNTVIQITDSGNDPVHLYSTALILRMTLTNTDEVSHQVFISPGSCCLQIATDDIDCQIMTLEGVPPVFVQLGKVRENNTETVSFAYRNLYARYRVGNCSFVIRTNGKPDWAHTVNFNSTPDDEDKNVKCSGLDQDRDRDCTPVDCAIKYKGRRSFYRKQTGKCEPVAPCHTRADDGITITGYYDWEENICVKYKWFQDDNYFEHVESDTEIPSKIDAIKSNYKYYAPHLKDQQDTDSIDCNHGVLDDLQCRCDEGWVSSGIHRDDPITFHWCDTPDLSTNKSYLTSTMEYMPIVSDEPLKLSTIQEISLIVTLALVNLVLLFTWIYLLVKIIRSVMSYVARKRKN
ncbi:PREDICTED: uncharacterized protein LOC100640200 [Amphimedon queenslandica]|uniref:Uncharacterized protein n=1 Tax=Amphimedon queenslandica TaxID=400682 RepID=A0AAN0IE03_AMPQE|nr:PREDICTED: uncharacterized protein LOC100640200 [Amphimedon queenslandica]|eukprot:XP_003386285.2 PREDICTED: uncharacterized protein LOC100640200 [Amphimedon queenslandica]